MNQPVPDATEHSHQSLIEIMKADAARQEPLTSVIGAMLEETVLRNDLKQKQSSLPAFTGRRPPLSASAFVARIAKYSGASPCCYAIGLIYLERMKKRDTGLYLNSTNFQRLFLVSTMTAAKFLDDFYYSNKHWAQIGGITTQEINRLELEFLFRMGFSLHMQREEYDWYAEELLSRVDCTPPPVAAELQERESIHDSRQPSKPVAGPVSSSTVVSNAGAVHVAGRSSAEDIDAFMSTHSTPKSSSSHMHDGVHAKQVAGQHMNMPVVPVGPTAPGPHPAEMLPRTSFDGMAPAGMMVHPGSSMPMAVPGYHGAPGQPWVYF